ncbi:hypothetical protein [Aquibacillus rhizosphaerae]|uniref:Uncharacterized protein n=1 Tax=Aquibacillus rhizosphaerae TaxID=3051431 RepID=A0ABT7KZM0_9BACI|nr:hypothetical protein [Aquibacillus sp. LR5S19]MDL4838928.1 hypothetical protein [Aquibacillus sp. LR5S19]
MKKIAFIFILLFILFFTFVPIVKGLYMVVFQSQSYLTFSSELVSYTKYFGVGTILFILILIFWKLTSFGKKVLPILIVTLMFGFLFTSVYFNAADEEHIVQQRIWKRDVKTWDQVTYISTKAYLEDELEVRRKRYAVAKFEYRIFFNDGSSVNLWDDIPSLYKLHTFVLQKGVEIRHKSVDEDIKERASYHIDGDVAKAKEILGIK